MTVLEEMISEFQQKQKSCEERLVNKNYAPTDSDFHRECRKRTAQQGKMYRRIVSFLKRQKPITDEE